MRAGLPSEDGRNGSGSQGRTVPLASENAKIGVHGEVSMPPDTTKGFTSWKEIASYLGKSVRTVQRWEREFCLPVQRPAPHRGIVRATKDELDRWLSTGWPLAKPEVRDEVSFLRKRVAELTQENAILKTKLVQRDSENGLHGGSCVTPRLEKIRELYATNCRTVAKEQRIVGKTNQHSSDTGE